MAEQIRVLVQAKPLPGAVHRPFVGRWCKLGSVDFILIRLCLEQMVHLK